MIVYETERWKVEWNGSATYNVYHWRGTWRGTDFQWVNVDCFTVYDDSPSEGLARRHAKQWMLDTSLV